jgi:S1-C subfamily serine protease
MSEPGKEKMFSNPRKPVRYQNLFLLVLFLALFTCDAFPQESPSSIDSRDQLKNVNDFWDTHPSIVADLNNDPSHLENQNYLRQHPELQKFIKGHPDIRDALLSKVQRCAQSVPEIFARASPAVVSIFATSINPYRTTGRVERIVGTGFIIDPSGVILSNSHVAFARQSLLVTLRDGTSLPAKLIGADPIFDVALLQVSKPPDRDFATLPLGDSNRVDVGGEAIAIGNPLGLAETLTRGIVSATNRVLPVTLFSAQEPLIQIDAPINPGNSGGPLINQCGEVVGITTAIAPDAQNIGFAIPINLVKALLPSLVSNGRVIRPWLGFRGQLIDETLPKLVRLPLTPGFMVEVVDPDSPADKAGLKGGILEVQIEGQDFLIGGDIITKINGVDVTQDKKLVELLGGIKVGTNIDLTVFRGGEEQTIHYAVAERPLLPGDMSGSNASFQVPKGAPWPRYTIGTKAAH